MYSTAVRQEARVGPLVAVILACRDANLLVASLPMGQWLEDRKHTIYVTAEDGKRYAFQHRKSNSNVGTIYVYDEDGRRVGVTGSKIGDKFKTNPLGKNASLLLTNEELELAQAIDPPELIDEQLKEYKLERLGPPKTEPKTLFEMSEQEAREYLDSMYPPPS